MVYCLLKSLNSIIFVNCCIRNWKLIFFFELVIRSPIPPNSKYIILKKFKISDLLEIFLEWFSLVSDDL